MYFWLLMQDALEVRMRATALIRVGTIGAIAISCASTASATEYGYHPASTMRLGAGVDPSNPQDAVPYCFTYSTSDVAGTGGSGAFRIKEVKDRRDLITQMNASVSLAGRYKFFSGSAQASVDEGYSFSSDSITWIISLTADFGRKEVLNEKPLPEFQAMLDAKKYVQFEARCGTELVTQERKVATVAAIFTVKNVAESREKTLEASLSAAANAEVFSAEASAKYRQFVSEASKSSMIDLDVRVTGGPGGDKLASLITDYGDLDKIKEVLRGYAASLNADNALTTGYITTSMSRYGLRANQLDVSVSDLALADYYLLFQDMAATKLISSEIIQQDDAEGSLLSQLDRANVEATYRDSDKVMRAVIKVAKACRVSDDACTAVADIKRPTIRWPYTDPLGNVGVVTTSVNCQNVGAASPTLPFMCTEKVQISLAAREARVQSLTVFDEAGQKIPVVRSRPYSAGEYLDVTKYISAASLPTNSGQSLSEADLIERLVVRGVRSRSDATAGGWSVENVSLNLVFGAGSATPTTVGRAFKLILTDSKNKTFERSLIIP